MKKPEKQKKGDELNHLLARSRKLAEIEAVMEKAYQFDDDGQPIETDYDLDTIGEEVATIMGYL